MTYINKFYPNVEIICINLKNRKDKKKYMTKELTKQIPNQSGTGSSFNKKKSYNFFKAKLNKNPKQGCINSHLKVINTGIKNGVKQLLIFEDDCDFLDKLENIPEPPVEWDMLYLGGTVKDIKNYKDLKENKPWVRMACWTTHAYLINLENEELIKATYQSR